MVTYMDKIDDYIRQNIGFEKENGSFIKIKDKMFEDLKEMVAIKSVNEVIVYLKTKPLNSLETFGLEQQTDIGSLMNEIIQPQQPPQLNIYLFSETEKQVLWNFVFNNKDDYNNWKKINEPLSSFAIKSSLKGE